MANQSPWVQLRGFERILAKETNISDLLQFLSDKTMEPWAYLIGFVPVEVERESHNENSADLLLTSADGRKAVVELKLGHLMSNNQQRKYEMLDGDPDLYLAALSMDRDRVNDIRDRRWKFLSLADVFDAWNGIDDMAVSAVASKVTQVLQNWDEKLSAVFKASEDDRSKPLSVLEQKFLARVATRRIAMDIQLRGELSDATVTSGGGLPIVQAWKPIRNESSERSFIAEVRWSQSKPSGALRFGVDFDPRPGENENEEVRRAAYDFACSMVDVLDFAAMKGHLENREPRLAGLLSREKSSRPHPKGDWEEIVLHGFDGVSKIRGKRTDRRDISPAFHGDGALRFQAMVDVDFERASAQDVTDLLNATLVYLTGAEPV